MSGRTGRVAGILSTAAVAALVVTALDAGVAQAGGLEQVEVLRTTAVLANLDSPIPPIVTTLKPGRDVAFPACRKADTDMVWIRFGTPDTLGGPQDVGWTYAQNLGHHRPLAPC